MNQVNHKSTINTLNLAKELIENAVRNNVTDEEILNAVKIVECIYKEKATAATVTNSNLIIRLLSGQDEVGDISLAPETAIRLD